MPVKNLRRCAKSFEKIIFHFSKFEFTVLTAVTTEFFFEYEFEFEKISKSRIPAEVEEGGLEAGCEY